MTTTTTLPHHSGADVNGKHGTTQLTPLQMACGHSEPDVETIRSFLDKGKMGLCVGFLHLDCMQSVV